jgi:hypothetical protein
VAVAKELGLQATIVAWSLRSLGYIACAEGDTGRAAAHFAESLALFRAGDTRLAIASCLAGLAMVASVDEQLGRAACLLGAVAGLLDALRGTLAPADASDYRRTVASLRDQLSTQDFAAAWSEGQGLTLEQAIEYAIGPPIS